MNVLLDSCVWGGALSRFREEGIDAVWAGDWPEDPGDEEILRRAHEGRRVLITLDKDFGELAVLHGFRHSGIIRLVGFRAEEQGLSCEKIREGTRVGCNRDSQSGVGKNSVTGRDRMVDYGLD